MVQQIFLLSTDKNIRPYIHVIIMHIIYSIQVYMYMYIYIHLHVQYMSLGVQGMYIIIPVYVHRPTCIADSIGYELCVVTGDNEQAGTVNNMHLVIVGQSSKSKNITVENSEREPKFHCGQTDTFRIAIPATIGPPTVSTNNTNVPLSPT